MRNLILSIIILSFSTLFGQLNPADSIRYRALEKAMRQQIINKGDSAALFADSLRSFLDAHHYPDGEIKLANLLGYQAINEQRYSECLQHYKRGLTYVSEATDQHGVHILYSNLGLAYRLNGRPDSGIVWVKKALAMLSLSGDSISLAKYYNILSDCYIQKENYYRAMLGSLKADSIYVALHDTLHRIYNLVSLQIVLNQMKLYEQSALIAHQAARLAAKKNPALLPYILGNLGKQYAHDVAQYDSARYFLDSAKSLSVRYGLQNLYSSLDVNLSGVLYHEGKYRKAIELLRPYIAYDNQEVAAAANVNTGGAFLQLNQLDSARYYLQRGLKIAGDGQLKEFNMKAHFYLYRLDTLLGRYKEALKHYIAYEIIEDTIFNQNLKATISQMKLHAKLENEAAEKEHLLKAKKLSDRMLYIKSKESRWLYAILTVLALLALMLVYMHKKRTRFQQKIKAVNIKLEQLNNDLKANNAKLLKLNEDKTILLSVISHDLRSSIGSINQMLNLVYLQFDELGNLELKEYLASVLSSSDKVFVMMDNLLKWARLQNDENLYLSYEGCAAPVVLDTADQMQALSISKNISIEVEMKHEVPVMLNEDLLGTVVRNLLDNAIKFSKGGTSIRIYDEEHEAEYLIHIVDQGVGMDAKTVEKLFSDSTVFSTPGTQRELGTGTGISLVIKSLKKMNASITVESEPGRGSTFTLHFKRA